jgi:glutamine synthetase
MKEFSFAVANRCSSIRIPRTTELKGSGYYEDRRPAANIDPYVVSSSLFSVTCLDNYGLNELEAHYEAFLKHKKEIGL